MHFSLEAIIIKSSQYGDAHLILKAISREKGKVSLIAHSALKSKRRFSSGLEVLDQGTIKCRMSPNNHNHLISAESFILKTCFKGIRENLLKLAAASTILETVDLLIPEEGDDSNSVYNLLFKALREVEIEPDPVSILRETFLVIKELLCTSGYLDRRLSPPPSFKNLMSLTNLVERVTEQKMLTPGFLYSHIESTLSSPKRQEVI